MALKARLLSRLNEVPASAWDALHDGGNPFISYAFLNGLEQAGCIREEWGWSPQHVTLWDEETLVAAAPGYLKQNSHGEFVFDHAWAHAYANVGLPYFPKWLGAVPYSPVTGPRLLAHTPQLRAELLSAIQQLVSDQDLSTAHVNFSTTSQQSDFPDEWLERNDIQFHWQNTGHWQRFEDFLAAMDHKHRKNIRQERSRVARSGIRFRTVEGHNATEADLQAMFGFYLQTFAEYGNHPALTLEFLKYLADTAPQTLVIFLAEDEHRPVAGALCLRGPDTLYGRYWGSEVNLPGLHFETCYYQGIDYCLRHGLSRFEPGAQGEHKLARGFLPEMVRSRHWIADPVARNALRQWCDQERHAVGLHARGLRLRSPFRTATSHSPTNRP